MTHGSSEARAQRRGLRVIVLLAVLTAVEYAIAVQVDSTEALLGLLTPIALIKAGYILWYFMHLPRVWRGEEEHA